MIQLETKDSSAIGGYILLLRLEGTSDIRIGRLGTLQFNSGYYAYVGSAMRGLKHRISRHLSKEKKLHWHIDYFLGKANVVKVIVCQSDISIECDIAGEIGSMYTVINGFGSSDCKCPGHLFYNSLSFGENIMRKLESAGMKPFLVSLNKEGSSI